ncbi:MAG: NAD(P)H-hydrate epimerase [Ilumatobacteraceae bacterium]
MLTDKKFPWASTDQMREVDRIMTDDLGIELPLMTESAGRHLAYLARLRYLDGDATDRRVVVLAGPGGNGGGALVAARRLHGWGANVTVVAAGPTRFSAIARQQLQRVHRLGIAVRNISAINDTGDVGVVLDGIIGYSLHGAPFGEAAQLIRWANLCVAPTIALDVPSGVDATSGAAHDPSIRAAATLTLAAPKVGLRLPSAAAAVGELYLADIGIPPHVLARAGIDNAQSLFASEEIVRIW